MATVKLDVYGSTLTEARQGLSERAVRRGIVTGLTDNGKHGHPNAGMIVLQRIDEQLIVQQRAA